MRDQFTLLIILTVLTVLTTFCTRECKEDDMNKGIILSSIALHPLTIIENGVIIEDSAAFADMFPEDVQTIDFNYYSLLGLYADAGGCIWSVTREVTQMDNEKQYHYKVTAYACGICKKEFYDHNWVIVPKLPEGWTVTFEKVVE